MATCGFHTWAKPSQINIDIILVHGPDGGPETTWTDDKSGRFWPKDLLAPRLKNARISSFTYKPAWDSFFVMEKGKDSTMEKIDELSTDLCKTVSKLQNDRERPVVFIAHSVGGLVCANILAQGTNRSCAYQPGPFKIIAGRCKGIVFLATPFCGDNIEDWTTITKKMCSNAKAEMNQQSGPVRVHKMFQSQLKDCYSKHKFHVDNLVEAGNEDSPEIIVTADYAVLENVTPVGFPVDHRSISKCADGLVCDHILETLKDIMEKMSRKDKPTVNYPPPVAMAPTNSHHTPHRIAVAFPTSHHEHPTYPATIAHARIVPSSFLNIRPRKDSQEDSDLPV